MDKDRILEAYPEAKHGGGTEGYSYDFPLFTIVKNITGTGGWIAVIKATQQTIDSHTCREGIERAYAIVNKSGD